MNLDLKDKFIIIAGGLGGIGQETVKDLILEGAQISILTQNESKFLEYSKYYDVHLLDYESEDSIKTTFEFLMKKRKPSGFISFVGTGRSSNNAFNLRIK